MYQLKVHRECREDIDELALTNSEWAAAIYTLLQELAANEILRGKLASADYGENPGDRFDITPVDHHVKHREEIWRLKYWDPRGKLIPYRILYAIDDVGKRYIALGVIRRDVCYDRNNEKVRRIIGTYARIIGRYW